MIKDNNNLSLQNIHSHSLLGRSQALQQEVSQQTKQNMNPKTFKKLLYDAIAILDKPKEDFKRSKIEKSISGTDRLQALIRIPEIQKELDEIKKEYKKKNRINMVIKFSEKYGVNPKSLEHPEVFHKYKDFFDRDAVNALCNYEKDYIRTEYKDGRHIIVAVDVTKKKKDIMREFENVLKRVNKERKIPKDISRDKETVQDIWQVYDYYKKDGLTFSEIARKLSGKKGNPTDNPQIQSYYKQVKRAYKKAEGIIKQINTELKQKA